MLQWARSPPLRAVTTGPQVPQRARKANPTSSSPRTIQTDKAEPPKTNLSHTQYENRFPARISVNGSSHSRDQAPPDSYNDPSCSGVPHCLLPGFPTAPLACSQTRIRKRTQKAPSNSGACKNPSPQPSPPPTPPTRPHPRFPRACSAWFHAGQRRPALARRPGGRSRRGRRRPPTRRRRGTSPA